MSNLPIPKSRYFHGTVPATTDLFNRIFDDINNSFLNSLDVSVRCAPDAEVIILKKDNSLSQNSVIIRDTSQWPKFVNNVNITYTQTAGTSSTLVTDDDNPGGYATFTLPSLSWADGFSETYSIKMDASFDLVYSQTDTFTGDDSTTSFALTQTADPSTITIYVDNNPETNFTYDSGTNSVVFSVAPSSGAYIEITYSYSVNKSKSFTTNFVVLAEPAEGEDAVQDPVPAIYISSTAQPILVNTDGLYAILKIKDISFTNPDDTIIRQWKIYHENDPATELFSSPSMSTYISSVTGSVGDGITTGDSEIELKIIRKGKYTIKLELKSSTYTNGNGATSDIYETTLNFDVLDMVQINPDFLTGRDGSVTAPGYTDPLNNVFGKKLDVSVSFLPDSADPRNYKRHVTVDYGIRFKSYVTDNGDGTFTITGYTNKTPVTGDLAWIDATPYKIIDANASVQSQQARVTITCQVDSGQFMPSTGTQHSIVIGPNADYVITLVYAEDNAEPFVYMEPILSLPYYDPVTSAQIGTMTPKHYAKFIIPTTSDNTNRIYTYSYAVKNGIPTDRVTSDTYYFNNPPFSAELLFVRIKSPGTGDLYKHAIFLGGSNIINSKTAIVEIKDLSDSSIEYKSYVEPVQLSNSMIGLYFDFNDKINMSQHEVTVELYDLYGQKASLTLPENTTIIDEYQDPTFTLGSATYSVTGQTITIYLSVPSNINDLDRVHLKFSHVDGMLNDDGQYEVYVLPNRINVGLNAGKMKIVHTVPDEVNLADMGNVIIAITGYLKNGTATNTVTIDQF